MTFGVSTACFYPLKTEKALIKIAELGIRDAEIFFNSHSELSGKVFEEILRIKSAYSMNISAVHPYSSGFEPFMLFSEYKRRFEDSLEDYKKFAEAAQKLCAPYIVIHGDAQKGKITEREYFSRFSALREVCKPFGAVPVQENVNKFRSQSPKFIKRMKAEVEGVGFVLDIKQCVRSGEDPLNMLEAMGENLVRVHLSDNAESQTCLLPFQGDFNFDLFFAKLKETPFNGSVITEVYSSQLTSLDHLRNAQNKLEENFLKK